MQAKYHYNMPTRGTKSHLKRVTGSLRNTIFRKWLTVSDHRT